MSGRNKKGQFTKSNKFALGAKPKYKREFAEELIDYFDIAPSRQKRIGKKTVTVANEYPTFEGFARSIGVTVRTLEGWRSKHKEFDEAYEAAKDSQRYILITNGLLSRYNANFAKFIALAHHGMPNGETESEAENSISVNITMIE